MKLSNWLISVLAEEYIPDNRILSIFLPDGTELLNAYLPMDITITRFVIFLLDSKNNSGHFRWTFGAMDVYFSNYSVFSRCSQEKMNLIKSIKSIMCLELLHKVYLINSKSICYFELLIISYLRHGTSMDYDFPQKEGTGIAKLIPHVSPECLDLIGSLLR